MLCCKKGQLAQFMCICWLLSDQSWGRAVLQACIDARSGDLAGWRQQQDILEKGIDVSYRPALGGAKCGASDSELAALIVRLLDDEKTRSQMLFDLQDFIVTGPKRRHGSSSRRSGTGSSSGAK